ncbi:MAG: hydroxyacid dehydrogenase [Imperialibacter sp.]|uniref:hydroxyacid dehydrogenase n=1 Tax=Imperialibacter sp. TaxID=2038411 RepID=UPI0032EFF77D
MHNILLLETVADDALEILQKAADVNILAAYEPGFDLSAISNHLVDAIVTRGKGQVNPKLMDACPALKVAGRCGVGLDNLDVAYATSKGIKIVNAPGSNAQTIAEHTMSLMMMMQRNLFRSVAEVKAGNWGWRNQFEGDEIYGKTLGILGLGNIGKKVAAMATAFGMKVIYWDQAEAANVPYTFKSFEEVITEADVITLHVPLLPETKELINAATLSKMKKSALLINTARGPIIDQQALYEALKNGTIAGFAADVLTEEPPAKDEPLLTLPNALITAHVGSLTSRTYTKMCVDTVNNVLAIVRGQQPMEGCVFNRKELADR